MSVPLLAPLVLAGVAASFLAGTATGVSDVPAALDESPRLGERWQEAAALEREARALEREAPPEAVLRYLGAAQRFETIARERPDLAMAWWRSSRGWWLAGDTLPLDAKVERVDYFARAEGLSARGLEADPDCAECMLWKFSSMGRLRTTRAVWQGIRQLPEMAALLDRGIELEPTYADDAENSTLGNLHYSSAIFYRIFPDWFWIGWIIGVKGDKDRSLAHTRTALSIHPSRLDYQIELGTQLLCLGTARREPARLAEGEEVMRAAIERKAQSQDDAREIDAARFMLAHPEKSCGYSGDTWVEVDPAEARRAASGVGP